ncbi:type 1 glutamine amidotransferase [Listeria seeligeri]|uniref:type 1 glutamine amidotransferase n=1 Tax=Listeria seeligeri TaxID=1640 RepID=UPI0016232210|nr:type 1 glutamine amidotransferase [Listeria seeligeri]MBC1528113.1 type 1 glutamine amidotransferase [Listeria seeligeri]MBC1532606.1 type 1 glutamine amidotransferase [Listeria seeligeri]MBC1739825.1 type 1 glutamine amidotransferase [Listeria seeligeri]MBC1745311.1 type 1 glutamine amidotransferase [Listeria seeligeri]MBC1748280.1 type 1 glutamine amidotransferase [Listeria seeligeri]
MIIDVLQHVPHEGPGLIAKWAKENQHQLKVHSLFNEKDQVPTDSEFLIILGGPMGVSDTAEFPWLEEERDLIKQLIEQEKPVFGVCLGAQQIATALGSTTSMNSEKEVGWFPVNRISTELSFFPERIDVFHWHQETFSLPNGATHLFASEACSNQGFLYGDKVIGLQFHFEMEEAGIEKILQIDEAFITPGEFVQSAAEMRESGIPEGNKQMLEAILDYLAEKNI